MDRKQTVKTISEHFGVKAKYLAAPSFAYEIKTEEHTYTIDREGKIMDERGQVIELRDVLNSREEEPVAEELTAVDAIENAEEATIEAPYEIALPLEGHDGRTMKNMLNMIYCKQPLIKTALELEEDLVEEEFIIAINDVDMQSFDSFKKHAGDIGFEKLPGITFDFQKDELMIKLPREIEGAEALFTLIYKLSKKQLRATFKVAPTSNEKYTFRTWLLRLGMIGQDYKEARRELLKNLSGNAAFKGGVANEA